MEPPPTILKWITFSTQGCLFFRNSVYGIFNCSHIVASEMLPANCIWFIPINNSLSTSSIACDHFFTPLATLALLMTSLFWNCANYPFCQQQKQKTHKNIHSMISWDVDNWFTLSPLFMAWENFVSCWRISRKGLSGWELKILFNNWDIISMNNLVENWIVWDERCSRTEI